MVQDVFLATSFFSLLPNQLGNAEQGRGPPFLSLRAWATNSDWGFPSLGSTLMYPKPSLILLVSILLNGLNPAFCFIGKPQFRWWPGAASSALPCCGCSDFTEHLEL